MGSYISDGDFSLTISYSDGSFETIPATLDMLPNVVEVITNCTAGDVNVTVIANYLGLTTSKSVFVYIGG